jgi:hypothetical protein
MLERIIDFYAGHDGVVFTTLADAADVARGRLIEPAKRRSS